MTGSILAVPWNMVMGVLRMCKMAATLQPEGAVWGPNMEPFSEARSLKLCPGLDFLAFSRLNNLKSKNDDILDFCFLWI